MSSHGGILLLYQVEQRMGMLLIGARSEDMDDCDALRDDPVFEAAARRLPEAGAPFCPQPTMSRLESAPSQTETAPTMAVMIDLFFASCRRAPASIVLDIDDTLDRVHGHAGCQESCVRGPVIHQAAFGLSR